MVRVPSASMTGRALVVLRPIGPDVTMTPSSLPPVGRAADRVAILTGLRQGDVSQDVHRLEDQGGGMASVLCPRIYSTDVNGFMCKSLEEAQLAYLRTLLRPAPSLIGRHAPYRAHEVEGPEGQLEYPTLVILLPPSGVNAGDPPPPGIVDARVRHPQGLGLLDPHGIIIDEDVNGVAPEALIHLQPKV